MPDCAGDLAQLLDSDLVSAGWSPDFIGPRTISELGYQTLLGSLRQSLLKKYISKAESNENEPERERKALNLFLENNEACREMGGFAGTYSKLPEETQRVIGEAQAIIDGFFHPNGGRGILLSLGSILARGDLGPGANVQVWNTDFYTKLFDSPLTFTAPELCSYYTAHVSSNPLWADAEKSRQTNHGWGHVPGSNLFFAPKTREISRVACTEPTLNMFFQKGMQALLELRLRQVFGLDLRGSEGNQPQQDKNRELARLGSIDGTYGTIDLSSASDRISVGVCEFLIPKDQLYWFMKTRSPATRLPNGELTELYMISSMGNAFTFPLETLIFASIVVASYRVLNLPVDLPRGASLGNFAVFGDDIIVRTEAYNLVCSVIDSLGFKVNHEKSFNTGLFRESCGSDWFSGRNVRGVYLKRLQSDADFYKAINRLNVWSSRDLVPLERTVQYLVSRIAKPLYVPMHEQDTSGIRSPLRILTTRFRYESPKRFRPNRSGSAYTIKRLGAGGYTYCYSFLDERSDTVDLSDATSLLSYKSRYEGKRRSSIQLRPTPFEPCLTSYELRSDSRQVGIGSETPVPRDTKRGSGFPGGQRGYRVIVPKWVRKLNYNGAGILLSAVAGRLRDGLLVIKHHHKKHVLRSRCSSCWDYPGPELARNGGLAGDMFYIACLSNLGEVRESPEG